MGLKSKCKQKIVVFLVVFSLVVGLIPLTASAETDIVATGACGENAEYTVTRDENGELTLTISGTGGWRIMNIFL